MTRLKPGTMKSLLAHNAMLNFRRSLYERSLIGDTLQAGESYIYLNGPNVEERRATQDDIDAVACAYAKLQPAVTQ